MANEVIHTVIVNGQQIMTVADTTANQDVVEAGYVFYDKSGNKVTGQGNRRIFIETFKEGATSVQEILDGLKDSAIIGDMCIISKEVSEEPIPEPTTLSPAAEEPVEPEPQPALHSNSFFVYLMGGEVKKETDALGNSTISTPVKTGWTPITDTSLIWSTIQTILDAIGVGEGDNSIIDRLDVIEDYLGMAEDHEAVENAIDTLKEVFDWINSSEGEEALGAEERLRKVEEWIDTEYSGAEYRLENIEYWKDGNGDYPGAENRLSLVETSTRDIYNIIGDGLKNDDEGNSTNLTEAIININNVLGSDNSKDTLIGRVSDLENWKDNEKFQYGGNTSTGVNKAVQDALYDLNTARSAIRSIKNYSFGIIGGDIDKFDDVNNISLQDQIDGLQTYTKNLAGENRTTETVFKNAEEINLLWEQIDLLQKKLNHAIFEPVKDPNSSDYILSYGATTLQETASHRNWNYSMFIDKVPYIYSSSDLFYVPEGWQMSITIINKENWTNEEGTTEFGFKKQDEVNKSYDLYAQGEFKTAILSSGYYSPYMGNGYGYNENGAAPDPSKIEIDITYCLI